MASISAYDFDIFYGQSRANSDADVLSRLPCVHHNEYIHISSDCIKTISSIDTKHYETLKEDLSYNSQTLQPLIPLWYQQISPIDVEKA